jgi:hypothetical protein
MLILSALFLAAPLAAPVQDLSPEKLEAAVVAEQLPSYPLNNCPISGEKLGSMGDPIDLVVEGRLVRLCCKGCVKKAKANPATAIAKIDAGVIHAQGPSYPLKTCVISGEKLGEMGDPIDVVIGTRLVRVCCKGCVKKAKAASAKHLATVDSALIAAQRKTYPLKTCVISGEKLGEMGDPIDILHGTQLVRLCCKGCVKKFKKDPATALAKIAKAGKK